uniref:CTCK domain-containing protein n=1 Tax=Ciona savignyi TaxID=51511 RepID=H2ZKD0_CIOSA
VFFPSLQRTESRECRGCSCPPTPSCPPGVSLIMDGCGCCKICAQQLHQVCDIRMVCDVHKGLYCSRGGVCKASPGVACYVGNQWYENGELYRPNCKVTCTCMDGDIACMPTCMPTKPPTRECSVPRLIHRRGQCCEEWVCSHNGRIDPSIKLARHEVRSKPKPAVTFRENCMVQTTKWTACSKTCGLGSSNRVSNDNSECKLKKEMRLCNLRPCGPPSTFATRRRSCKKTVRHNRRVRFSLSGCRSKATYRPKYCGTCPGKCCGPKVTKTIKVIFECESGPDFAKNMMLIKKCSCERCPTRSDFFFTSYNRAMLGDMV